MSDRITVEFDSALPEGGRDFLFFAPCATRDEMRGMVRRVLVSDGLPEAEAVARALTVVPDAA